jgi:hypothetical protein
MLKNEKPGALRILMCNKYTVREFKNKYDSGDLENDEVHPDELLPMEVIEQGR